VTNSDATAYTFAPTPTLSRRSGWPSATSTRNEESTSATRTPGNSKVIKNGADFRLAVDAVEGMFRLPELTYVVIVAGGL
jgi:hypothetical protein